jgi:mRNA export factor
MDGQWGVVTSGSNVNPNQDAVVANAPTETVSCMRWSPVGSLLGASSWSKEVRIWSVNVSLGQATPTAIITQTAPVLTCDWNHNGNIIFHGACDGGVRMSSVDRPSTPITVNIGQHDAPVKSIVWNKTIHATISGSWDKTVRFFDPRKHNVSSSNSSNINNNNSGSGSGSGSAAEVTLLKMRERVHAMDNRENLLAVATAERAVSLYDLRNLKVPFKEYTTPILEKTSTSLCIFPDRKAFALGSIEGRVRIEYLDDAKKSFVFRCHKVGNFDAYGVNAMAVTDAHDAMATAGSDGSFVFWEKEKRQRLQQFERMPQPITACCFNRDGNIFAYATGYDWSKGIQHYDKTTGSQIFLHGIDPKEITPRAD